MWLMSFLPDFIFHLVFFLGVAAMIAGYFLTMIPFVGKNAKLLQVAGIIVTVIGVWFEGGLSNEASWQSRVADMEQKVLAAEAKSAEANTELESRSSKKNEVARTATAAVHSSLNKSADTIDGKCVLVPEVSSIHNAAVSARKGIAQ